MARGGDDDDAAVTVRGNTAKSAWGPQLWHSMHMIALNYPNEPSEHDRVAYKRFFEGLKDVIPCLSCADHYAAHLRQLPIDDALGSCSQLFAWTVRMHNLVSRSLGKPAWTVARAAAYYDAYDASWGGPSPSSGADRGPGDFSDRGPAAGVQPAIVAIVCVIVCAILACLAVVLLVRRRR